MSETTASVGRLYIVPTPIGNLEDMTFRGVRILREVDRILAEDTRRTRILCDRYGVTTRVTHCDDHTVERMIPGLLAELAAGQRIALVSDAGTPGISDPGPPLVRAAWHVVPVEALPGATAVTTALSGSGFACERFVFEGFLPRKGMARRRRLEALVQEERTVAFFESPQRLAATLADLEAAGAGSRPVMVARELTKVFETLYRGSVAELAARFAREEVRGEIVVILDKGSFVPPSREQTVALLDAALAQGVSIRDATRNLAPKTGLSASELYKMALERRQVE
ncbi:MAG: 16S rRNA (cytidine(1402)-2'-O)-methyltransferase [Magnetococcales bacterium]|nr:16S rRNA (cytidine(1402)-2'-O)-methyltransferase [Magnetococcales bacterium]